MLSWKRFFTSFGYKEHTRESFSYYGTIKILWKYSISSLDYIIQRDCSRCRDNTESISDTDDAVWFAILLNISREDIHLRSACSDKSKCISFSFECEIFYLIECWRVNHTRHIGHISRSEKRLKNRPLFMGMTRYI